MAQSNKINSGNIVKAVGAIAASIAAMTPIINVIADKISIDQKSSVVVPLIYGGEHQLTIDDAEKMLSDRGLVTRPLSLYRQEANEKYRNCFDLQVLSSDPKPKQKVKVGDTVTVWYITQEVIDESQKIFDETQRQKSDAKQARARKRTHIKR